MSYKSCKDYVREIADKINSGEEKFIENPTLEDILSLKDFDYIVTNGAYFPVIIRKRYAVEMILNIPTVMWYDGYEIGDSVMGMIPGTYSPEEVLEALKGYRNELDIK